MSVEPRRSRDERYPLALDALAAFGERRQLLVLAEELAEAAAAVSRLLNEKGDKIEVLTELVDVESVTASLRDVLGSAEAWDRVRLEKRAKLAAKLAKGEIRTRPAYPDGTAARIFQDDRP